VPTPQVAYNGSNYTGTDVNNDGVIDNTDFDLATQEYKSIGWVSGIFKSFEMHQKAQKEIKEVTYAVGAEYSYQDSFALRLGYFHESPQKEQVLSLGAGFKYTSKYRCIIPVFSFKSTKSA
jgi:hypothetical protein